MAHNNLSLRDGALATRTVRAAGVMTKRNACAPSEFRREGRIHWPAIRRTDHAEAITGNENCREQFSNICIFERAEAKYLTGISNGMPQAQADRERGASAANWEGGGNRDAQKETVQQVRGRDMRTEPPGS